MAHKQSSLAKRYTGKLLANIATVPVYLVMEAVLPRALGPGAYGNFNFATSLFTQFAAFLDMGTSTCFYNALSRRQQEQGLIAFYLRVALFVFAITLAAGCFMLVPNIGTLLMPDVPLWYAPLAALFGFLLWGTRVARSMNDALGLTVSGEILRSAMNLGGTIVLLGMFALGVLNVGTLFGLQYLMMGGMVIGSLLIMRRCWDTLALGLSGSQRSAYTREFYVYSSPLFVQALLAAVGLWAERWVLQIFDGSVQQGYFALSQRVSMACFMFVSAMTPLLMRELAIAWGQQDTTRMAMLVDRFAPLLFAVAAWFSCFTVLEAESLVRYFGGAEFAAALLPVQIMALYPAHQAYGQLASSVFHATGKTRILRNLAIFEHCGGFVLVLLLVAPPDVMSIFGETLGGWGLGAAGLAIKTVLTQVVMVNVLLWLASRFVPLHFWRNIVLQCLILAVLLSIAWGARTLTLYMDLPWGDIVRFVVSAVLYGGLSCIVVLACPMLVGVSRQDVRELLARCMRRKQPKS